ncbi:MAG: hypothetical protein EXS17_07200 [Phycisphaerales bacterium]|nr:hypothetical protein [Phycisphaerales bacterium]
MLATTALQIVLAGLCGATSSGTLPSPANPANPTKQVGWPNLQAQWPRQIEFTTSHLIERAQGRRSCVLTGNDGSGPIQAVIVERGGFLAGTLVDGSGVRWGARGVSGTPLHFDPLPPEAMKECAGAVEAPPELLAQGAFNPASQGGIAGGCVDAATVDVVILTTPAARIEAGGVGQLAALVDLAEASANAAYSNSAIAPRIRIVFEMEVDYEEVSFGSDLSSLADGTDGVLDEVHALRDAAGADLVAMIRSLGEYGGIAYLLPNNDPSSSGMGFSVTAWGSLSSQTLAHELGHNMGCCHAPNDGGGCLSGGIFPKSLGHRFNGSSGTQYRTVMAYAPGSRIDHFSNPLVNFNNTPTGLAPVGADPGRDNAATIATTNAAIRGFRCAAPPGSFGDCDQDGRIDITQIAAGSASDCDGNGQLDSCDLASTPLCSDPARFLCAGGVISGLPSPSLAQDNYYGYAVDTDGRTAVVGAYGDDVGANFAGSAAVYALVGNTPQLVATLRHVNPGEIDLFGRAVAVDAGFIAIGSVARDVLGFNAAGDVSVFAASSTGAPWQLVATLTAPTPQTSGGFGFSVALRSNVLVVGSPEAPVTQGAPQRGHAYVYERIGSTWTLVKTLAPLDATNQGNFGSAVAVANGVIVIGAQYVANASGVESGAVYTSSRVANTWQNAVRVAGLPATAVWAGSSVSTDGERIAVGSPGAGVAVGIESGAVYVLERSQSQGSPWQVVQSVLPAQSTPLQKFGTRVSIDGYSLVIGSIRTVDVSGTHELFTHDGSAFNRTLPVRSGLAVAIRGEYCAVGSPRDIQAGIAVGGARIVLRLTDGDGDASADRCERARGDIDLNGTVEGADLAALLAAWGESQSIADIDRNGVVDGSDLAVVLASWGSL